jgi:hypothetical protein
MNPQGVKGKGGKIALYAGFDPLPILFETMRIVHMRTTRIVCSVHKLKS